MPAEFTSGFSVREPMWHGLGNVIPENPAWEDVPRLAGWPTHVSTRPMFVGGDDDGQLTEAKGVKAIVNDDTGDFIAPCSESYGIVQPETMIQVLEALAGVGAIVETAGALREMKQLWALARLPKEYEIAGDAYQAYVSIHNSFDGSLAFQAARHGVRIVCANTQDMALTEATNRGTLYKWKHTARVMDRIEQAKAVVMGLDEAMQEFVDLAQDLAERQVSQEGVNTFLEQFIPAPPAALITDRAMKNVHEARAAVLSIVNGETGTVRSEVGHTSYGLFVSGIEYLDYIRPSRSKETQFGRAILTPDKAKAHLLKLATSASR